MPLHNIIHKNTSRRLKHRRKHFKHRRKHFLMPQIILDNQKISYGTITSAQKQHQIITI